MNPVALQESKLKENRFAKLDTILNDILRA